MNTTLTPQQHTSADSVTDAIPRHTNVSYGEFIDEYVKPNQPVIISDAIDHWAAVGKWTPDFFRKEYASMDLEMDGLKMAEFIDLVEGRTENATGRLPYLRNKSVTKYFPELKPDISPLPIYLQPNWFDNPLVPKRISQNRTDLFIGGPGSQFPYLHFDNYHGYAFILQVYGEKEFVVIPPEQSEFVYPEMTDKGIANASSIPDIDNPDLSKFPLFAKTTPSKSVLKAGDMLFVPAGWWHTARMHSPSITISSNTASAYNWSALMSDHWMLRKKRPLKAVAGVPYLRAIWAWESIRDRLYRNRRLRNSVNGR